MAGGLTLLTGTNASIPTPASGKVTLFFSTDLNAPAYKDSSGVVHLLLGPTGATGTQGLTGDDGPEPDILIFPGPQGPIGSTGPAGPSGPIGPVYIIEDGLEGEQGFPGPAGANGTGGGGGGNFTLIGQGEGSNTTAAATTVFSLALASSLTTKDSLLVVLSHSSAGNSTAQPIIINTTDSIQIAGSDNLVNISSNRWCQDIYMISCDHQVNTGILCTNITSGRMTSSQAPTVGSAPFGSQPNFITPWTGNWTIALQTGAGGVTAGGTYHFRIAVYKLSGQ